jgi:predicted alpha/beta-fold hydrolase
MRAIDVHQPQPFTVDEFRTTPRLRNGHRMTLFTWARPRHFARLPPAEARYFDPATDTRVLAHCHWQPHRHEHLTLLLFHGLEGSSTAHYMLGIADKAYAAGMNVVRLNQRNCGGTEHLSAGLYHSGLTDDPAFVVRELLDVDRLPRVAIAGYSLGGNLALKLAGEYGDDAPSALVAICAVSPTIELGRCVEMLERPNNWMYQWNFVRNLKRRMRRKARLFPGRFALNGIRAIRTVREFDEAYTAPFHGFRDADDYYHRASAMRVIDRVRVPTLIITAEDDPFIPVEPFRAPALRGNAHITVSIAAHGGHCGFVSDAALGNDGYWAERTIVEFIGAHHRTRASIRVSPLATR